MVDYSCAMKLSMPLSVLSAIKEAREIADITIASENLQSIIALREISTALMNRIKCNYRFIVGFNSALIGMGLTGVITPSTSALLHNGSTIMTGVKSTTRLIETKVN